ncbi:hypothetical protein KKJ23_24080, partial [Xenorhabdus bovienii]|nr:hypothetical protein [Xenorhabdus bovienii]
NANSNANGRVPADRKVNGKALTNDIALNAGDVGAYNRAETDSRVNDVRVLVNEAKNAANNLINGIRLSAFRLYRIGSDRSEYANGNEDPLVIKYFGHPKMDGFSHVSARGRRRAGEVIV